ncbi:hypothetical protein NSA19_06000 [Actinomyces bowdenii]|uniref:hypothetical protein n=1 Tax=Actinomyces bowdenii TaxID=131109 RepID=UPI00214B2047|nr:hypothetical protein [Actinomyces bowdenii]MCR2052404.1 hypothetical protein [Actinomyces bowdenii]
MADTPDGADGAGATSTQRARAARLVRRSRIGMLIGWTLSMAGSEVFARASPALVVASALPAAWIAWTQLVAGRGGCRGPCGGRQASR